MNTHPQTVLWIDAAADAWNLRSLLLAKLDLQTDVASTSGEAIHLLRNRKYAAVVIGCSFSDLEGPQLCRDLRRFDEQTPVVFFGESVIRQGSDEAYAAGADAYVPRAEDPTDLVDLLAKLIAQNETDSLTNYKKATGNKN
jgi:CheY-like chemotaxis protein